jgi:head-tail adaptor
MRAGALRYTVSADEPVTQPDGQGGVRTVWYERAKFKAAIEPVSGREQMRSDQIIAELDTRIRLRWSVAANGIRATWRLRHGATVYDLVRPPIGALLGRREIELLVRTGARYFPPSGDESLPAAPAGAVYFNGQLLYLNDNIVVLT